MGIHRGHRARPLEWIIEKGIFLVSMSAVLMILLIFVFIGREAAPALFQQMNSAAVQEVWSVEQASKKSKKEIAAYLGMSVAQVAEMGDEGVKEILQIRIEAAAEGSKDKDANINTTEWRYLIGPHQWTGYDKPSYIWQPVSEIHKYNLVPLFIGSLKATLVALLFSVPLAIGAAIYVSQMAPPRIREIVKPAIELLAGIPSVVLGFFALLVMASVLQGIFGYESRLNAFVAGIALGLAVIPVIFSISEDALTSVPRSYTQGALAVGASKWQAAAKIVLPAALPGVFAATALGFGRAIGETMIVLMASGNASIVSWNIFDSTRTITATIAAELAETVFGGHHYRLLFLIGLMLFTVTFIANLVGELVIHRLKGRLEGKA